MRETSPLLFFSYSIFLQTIPYEESEVTTMYKDDYEEDYRRAAIPPVVRKVMETGGPINYSTPSSTPVEGVNPSSVTEVPVPGSIQTQELVFDAEQMEKLAKITGTDKDLTTATNKTEKATPKTSGLFKDIRQTTLRLIRESVNSDTLTEREKVSLLTEIHTFSETILKERFDIDL